MSVSQTGHVTGSVTQQETKKRIQERNSGGEGGGELISSAQTKDVHETRNIRKNKRSTTAARTPPPPATSPTRCRQVTNETQSGTRGQPEATGIGRIRRGNPWHPLQRRRDAQIHGRRCIVASAAKRYTNALPDWSTGPDQFTDQV